MPCRGHLGMRFKDGMICGKSGLACNLSSHERSKLMKWRYLFYRFYSPWLYAITADGSEEARRRRPVLIDGKNCLFRNNKIGTIIITCPGECCLGCLNNSSPYGVKRLGTSNCVRASLNFNVCNVAIVIYFRCTMEYQLSNVKVSRWWGSLFTRADWKKIVLGH